MIRLQGNKFRELRPKLKFVAYAMSKNGNIRAHLSYGKEKRARYYHWLNPMEAAKFKQSKYFDNPDYIIKEFNIKRRRKNATRKTDTK